MKGPCRWTPFFALALLLTACAPLQPDKTEIAVAAVSPSPSASCGPTPGAGTADCS